MKPQAIKKNNRKVYWIVAVICLVYGGVALLMFVYLSNFIYFRPQANFPVEQINNISATAFQRSQMRPRSTFTLIPLILTLIGSLVSITAGSLFIKLLREKERKELKKEVIDSMVMPDEKIVIEELEKNNGALTQSELVGNTGLSKVKVHRIIKRLESLGIVKKYPYGVTNKIKLEKILDD